MKNENLMVLFLLLLFSTFPNTHPLTPLSSEKIFQNGLQMSLNGAGSSSRQSSPSARCSRQETARTLVFTVFDDSSIVPL